MIATMKTLVLAALTLAASSARAEERWQVEGAFPVPSSITSGVALEPATGTGSATDTAVASDTTTKAATKSGCHLSVELTSLHAVGQPCLTTADVMNQLGLSAKAQARVEHLSKAKKTKKTAH